jgi:predicted transcriptional regulator
LRFLPKALCSGIIAAMPHDPTSSERLESMMEALRHDAGMNPGEIARQAHISRTTVWRLAGGVARQPLYETGVRIERLYTKIVRDGMERR